MITKVFLHSGTKDFIIYKNTTPRRCIIKNDLPTISYMSNYTWVNDMGYNHRDNDLPSYFSISRYEFMKYNYGYRYNGYNDTNKKWKFIKGISLNRLTEEIT